MHRTVFAWSLLGFLAFALAAEPIRAQSAESFPSPSPEAQAFGGEAGADLGLGKVGEDWFLGLVLRAGFAFDKLMVNLQVPLRFRVVDNKPTNGSVLREEDWDEISDYFRVIRSIQWSKPGDVFYARVGELAASMGNATLMNNYINVIDIDHFQLGLDTELNLEFGGAQVVLDNFADPEVFGLRLYARPWAFVDAESFWVNWAVGSSLIVDAGAPLSTKLDADGSPRVDEGNTLDVRRSAVFAWGLDNSFRVFENELLRVTPYMDHNVLIAQDAGYGFHLGVLSELLLPADNSISLRLEYQFSGADYLPQYFDTLYELHRVRHPLQVDGVAASKQQVLDELDEEGHGFMGQLVASILGYLTITGQYRGSTRPNDNDLLLQLKLPSLDRIKLAVVYSKFQFASAADAFDLDNALFTAYLRGNVWLFLDVIVSFSRQWQLVTNAQDSDYGEYRSADEWNVGFGASIPF
ncbi:MAG: hypothetical protein RBU37_16145 [Myxococcota bacterium]|jgi:hypothetical protein|nr:hypothetical protein [Myxococcota bacterium]